jgi:hypothetical protein
LIGAELLLGRAADLPTTAWEGMFLPDVFRRELEEVLGAKPELVYARKKVDPPGALWLGQGLLTLIGLLLAVAILIAWKMAPRLERAALVFTGFVLGTFGLVLWTLAVVSAFSELRMNEVLLVLVPADYLVGILPRRSRRLYLRGRLAGLLLVALLSLAGVLIQELRAPISMVALPMMIAAYILTRGNSRED